MAEFLQRLKQRKLVQWAIAYVAAAWVVLQVLDLASGSYGWPRTVMHIAFGVLAVGFVVTLVLAWYHGERGVQRISGVELLIIALVLAVGGGVLWNFSRTPAKAGGTNAVASVRKAGPASPSASGAGANPPPTIAASTARPAALAIAAQPIPVNSVAVLPLVNLGGNPKDEYLGDGISEEVLDALSRLPELKVIGRASSFHFRGNDIDVGKVGRALGARSLLSGTVQRSGDELRITVELVDTQSGVQLWSQQYDRTMKGLFALEDDISSAVVKALAVKLGAAADRPLVAVATTNPHAHDLYLRAVYLSQRTDQASLNQAVALFTQVIAEDPNYAAAWVGLAQAYVNIADAYRAPVDLLPAMQGAAEKAVTLDPTLAEAHSTLGRILFVYARDFPAARRELERAVALNPNSGEAHAQLGWYLYQHEHDAPKARAELQIAVKLDPLNAWHPWSLVWIAIAQGDAARALQMAQRVRQLNPDFFYRFDLPMFVYASSGQWRDCIARSAQTHPAAESDSASLLAICYAEVGQGKRARDILTQLENTARTRYVDATFIAGIYAALDDKDRAFAALDRAAHDRSATVNDLWFYPWFKPLHRDPRYQALLKELKSPYAAQR
ncbi:MAG: tetratricopeptide repeat protein [Rhodanobacteraceae bacterium]